MRMGGGLCDGVPGARSVVIFPRNIVTATALHCTKDVRIVAVRVRDMIVGQSSEWS